MKNILVHPMGQKFARIIEPLLPFSSKAAKSQMSLDLKPRRGEPHADGTCKRK
jgi:hypothetical protein